MQFNFPAKVAKRIVHPRGVALFGVRTCVVFLEDDLCPSTRAICSSECLDSRNQRVLPQRLQGETRYIGRACIESFDITIHKVWYTLMLFNRVPFVDGLASDWILRREMYILFGDFKRGTTVRSNKVTSAAILNVSYEKSKGGELGYGSGVSWY